MMQSALAGINIGPCSDHPCSSGYLFSSYQQQTSINLPFPNSEGNMSWQSSSDDIVGVPPCGDHGICKPQLDNFTCECPLYSTGSHCQYQLPLLDTNQNTVIPSFNSNSFLHFEDDEIAKKYVNLY